MLGNVEEQPTICVHAFMGLNLRTQLVLMHAQLEFMRTWACSCIRIFFLSSYAHGFWPVYMYLVPTYVDSDLLAHATRQKP